MEGEFLDGLSAEGVKVDEPPKRFHDDPNPSIVCWCQPAEGWLTMPSVVDSNGDDENLEGPKVITVMSMMMMTMM